MRIVNRITGINGVTSGGLATVPLQVNRRYHTLKFKTYVDGVLTIASTVIDTVRAKVNGTTIWELTAAQILALNTADGLPNAAGELALHFSNPARADIIDEEATAWDLFGESDFMIELVCKTLGGAAVPMIKGVQIFDTGGTFTRDAQPRRVKTIVRRASRGYAVPAGAYDITTLSFKDPILRLWLDGAQVISQVEVKADSLSVFEAEVFENVRNLLDYGIDGTVHKFPVLFDYTNRLVDFLQVSRELNVNITSAAAHTLTVVSETLTGGFN